LTIADNSRGENRLATAARYGESFSSRSFESRRPNCVSSIGLSGSAHFIGPVEAPQPLLQQSQIFVLASYADPCCLVIPEAREAGCAIVATAVGGTPELLGYGEAGQLVEPGKPEQFAKALRGLMQDEEALRQWRTRAKTGAAYFTVDRVVEDYDKVYAALQRA
jgi:glycosyltransferase involved in cell wall biosynthesis